MSKADACLAPMFRNSWASSRVIERYFCPKRVFFAAVANPGRGLGFVQGSPLEEGFAHEYSVLKSCNRA
jgi:hypothetical protein